MKRPARAEALLMDLSKLSTDQKRVMGEMFGEHTVQTVLPNARKLARAQTVGSNGIDDLYKVNRPDVDYVVVEYKFGSSKLGSTADGLQMSDAWLLGGSNGSNRILDAVDDAVVAKNIRNAVESGRVERWVVHTDPTGGVSVGLLDQNGKFIPRPDMASRILGGTL